MLIGISYFSVILECVSLVSTYVLGDQSRRVWTLGAGLYYNKDNALTFLRILPVVLIVDVFI